MSRQQPSGLRARPRLLTSEERALWKSVTASVVPLGGARASPTDAAPLAAAPAPAPATDAMVLRGPERTPPPPLAPLGRRARQRVARGRAPIDARLDLHGMTQERAHAALLHFLRRAQAEDARLVLVITGKGTRPAPVAGGDRGVLRRLVPRWLELPEFRGCVVGFEPAHVSHGGEGALYVQVRRRTT